MLSLLLVLFTNFSTAHAAGPVHALPIQIAFDTGANERFNRQLHNFLQQALNLVSLFPPPGYENNLFTWTEDRKILTGKNLVITFTTSQQPSIASLLANSSAVDMDAFTVAPMNLTRNSLSIYVMLLVDEIFYDRQGFERPDGFAHLVLALAHEIYGNVQHFLEFDMAKAKTQTISDRVHQQQKAFLASIMFLGNLSKDPKAKTLPYKIKKELLDLMPQEVQGYRSWQIANPSNKPDPACEAMLASLKKK